MANYLPTTDPSGFTRRAALAPTAWAPRTPTRTAQVRSRAARSLRGKLRGLRNAVVPLRDGTTAAVMTLSIQLKTRACEVQQDRQFPRFRS